jgi:SAM-dependent methyltransferase
MANAAADDFSIYEERWRAVLAPRTGDVRQELMLEASEYLGIPLPEVEANVANSAAAFPEEWKRLVPNPSDPQQVVRFYNESKTELFEQIAWHSTDAIHHRSLVCSDLAVASPGREFLDYGSGIGSNALVFGLSGYRVTLADVADPLRNFAKWRCERRGITVHAVDLKRASLPQDSYDVITCFDVLEHVPDPDSAVRKMREALRPGGLFFLYAPFGLDPVRPMHIVHDDGLMRRIRSMGFARKYEWEHVFPKHLQSIMPLAYERVDRSALANSAYFLRDVWLNGPVTDSIVVKARTWLGRPPRAMQAGAREDRLRA